MSILATNRRARHDYQLHDTFTAGLVLTGGEVKSVKTGRGNLNGSFVRLRNNEAWLMNAYIAPYQSASAGEERRARKLLLTRRELQKLDSAAQNNQQIVPLSLRVQRGFVKLEFATANARRKADKRAALRAREAERDIDRRISR